MTTFILKITTYLKNHKKIFLVLLIVIVAVLAYGLGYLQAEENSRTPIIIQKTSV